MKALVGANRDVSVFVKYHKDIRIKGGIPCIVLCNEDMDWLTSMSPSVKLWFEANCIIYYLQSNETFY